MKRSDIGPFGVVTLVLTLLVQVAALAQAESLGRGVTAVVPPRWPGGWRMTWACRRGVPAARGSGLGALVAGTVPSRWCPIALLGRDTGRGGGVRLVFGVGIAAGLAVSAGLTALAVRRLGGITGDVLGALVEIDDRGLPAVVPDPLSQASSAGSAGRRAAGRA